MVLAALALLLAPVLAPAPARRASQVPDERVATPSGLELPADPLTELVRRIEADARLPHAAAPAGASWSALWPAWERGADSAWNREPPWRLWVELVRAEAAAAKPDAARRASLALLARLQGRDTDAWRHLRACGADALVLEILPAFVPGAPLAVLGAPTLPDGVLLSPALPPSTDDPAETLTTLAGRSFLVPAVRVGEAKLSLELALQGDGVQVDLVHCAGPAVSVSVLLPCPRGVEIALTYADWEKLADPRAPIRVQLSAEAPEHTLWGRFLPRVDRWPMPLAVDATPEGPRAPLALATGEDPAADGRLPRFAEALAELFDRPCLWPYDPAQAQGPLEPIVIHLGTGKDPERRFAAMISLVETHALGGRGLGAGTR
jgi:hypothetical protein